MGIYRGMRNYFSYICECLKWAFWRFGNGVNVALSIILGVVSIGGFLGIWLTSANNWWSLVPFGFILLFIAPYKLWKGQEERLLSLLNRCFDIELLPVEPPYSQCEQPTKYWYRINVTNRCSEPAKKCYGKLISFKPKHCDIAQYSIPAPGLRFPWTTHGGIDCHSRTIGGGSPDTLDILTYSCSGYIELPELAKDNWTRIFPYTYPATGSYELQIEVGSEDKGFRASTITVLVECVGGDDTLKTLPRVRVISREMASEQAKNKINNKGGNI